ncbi:transposase [Streptomyces sp. NPDC001450]
MGSKYTKRYTAEFKRDAIELVRSTGRTVTEVARELLALVRLECPVRNVGGPRRSWAGVTGPEAHCAVSAGC